MELRHLRYFVAVAHLRLAQPALSRQVADLEDELGVDLLIRTSHGVRLTEEGKLFLAEARVVLDYVDESIAKVRALARGEFGELQVGYVPHWNCTSYRVRLRGFKRRRPGLMLYCTIWEPTNCARS
jgi:DNA-binding transcriptional LysR family regulator